tara:strand:- start:5138 stop:7279 length:2142 start_codon:yes stop_codon:yes gene_type:complete
MGFASGLKNWNSISSNIIQANQGAKELELREEAQAPAKARHEAMLKKNKRGKSGYDLEVRRERKLDKFKVKKAKRDLDITRQIDDSNDELNRIVEEMHNHETNDTRFSELVDEKTKVENRINRLMGSIGQSRSGSSRVSRETSAASANADAVSRFQLKLRAHERTMNEANKTAEEEAKFNARLKGMSQGVRDSVKHLRYKLEESRRIVERGPVDVQGGQGRMGEGVSQETVEFHRRQAEEAEMELEDIKTRILVADLVENNDIAPNTELSAVLGDPNVVVMDKHKPYTDEKGAPLLNKEGEIMLRTSMNREATLRNVKARLQVIADNKQYGKKVVTNVVPEASSTSDARKSVTQSEGGSAPDLLKPATGPTTVTTDEKGTRITAPGSVRTETVTGLRELAKGDTKKFFDFLDSDDVKAALAQRIQDDEDRAREKDRQLEREYREEDAPQRQAKTEEELRAKSTASHTPDDESLADRSRASYISSERASRRDRAKPGQWVEWGDEEPAPTPVDGDGRAVLRGAATREELDETRVRKWAYPHLTKGTDYVVQRGKGTVLIDPAGTPKKVKDWARDFMGVGSNVDIKKYIEGEYARRTGKYIKGTSSGANNMTRATVRKTTTELKNLERMANEEIKSFSIESKGRGKYVKRDRTPSEMSDLQKKKAKAKVKLAAMLKEKKFAENEMMDVYRALKLSDLKRHEIPINKARQLGLDVD